MQVEAEATFMNELFELVKRLPGADKFYIAVDNKNTQWSGELFNVIQESADNILDVIYGGKYDD